MMTLLVLAAIAALMSPLSGQAVDKTVAPRETGQAVVDAVVDRIRLACIFDNDKLMLRRMAKTESDDGQELSDSGDYSGGIWRISQSDYQNVKNNGRQYFSSISKTIGVDFGHSVYDDLEKPLYSGLAATMKLFLADDAANIPWNCTKQADFWMSKYQPNSNGLTEDDYRDVCRNTEGCSTPKADIVIVIDESGSIGVDNFDVVRTFVEDLVGSFQVSAGGIRIGIIKFSTRTTTVTELGALTSTAEIQSVVHNMGYSGGNTYTDLALLKMRDMLKNGRDGEGIPQIGIILTDGKSTDPQKLKEAVKEISKETFTVFSVGVTQNVDLEELQLYSSDPDCLHVYQLDTFDDMTGFLAEIQNLMCKAPAELPPGEEVKGELGEMEYLFFRLKMKRNKKGISIKLRMETGSCKMFLSWKVRNPGPAIYDYVQDVNYNHREGGTMFIPWPEDYDDWDEIYLYGAIVGGPGTIAMTNQYIMEYTDGMFSDSAGFVTANIVLLLLPGFLALIW